MNFKDLERFSQLLKIEIKLLEYVETCESYKSYYEEVYELTDRSMGSYTLDSITLINNFGKDFDWKPLIVEKLKLEIKATKNRLKEYTKDIVYIIKNLPELNTMLKDIEGLDL